MERRKAAYALEDDLQAISREVKKAHCLLMELMDDFFCLDDEVRTEWGVARFRSGYAGASVKMEIARDLMANVRSMLEDLLTL